MRLRPVLQGDATRDGKRHEISMLQPLRERARSGVVAKLSFWVLKFGQNDVRAQERMVCYVAADLAAKHTARRRFKADLFDQAKHRLAYVGIAPDGR